MSQLADFTRDQYIRIINDYAKEFPDDTGINNSSAFFSLLISQYISDAMINNHHLEDDYHGVLLEQLVQFTKAYIDSARSQLKMHTIDWEHGKQLLQELNSK